MAHRRRSHFAFVLLLALAGLLMIREDQRAVAAQTGNLLQNPGFEGAYRAWNSIPEIQVAANWTPWWWEDPNHNPAYFRPEYKRALASIFPRRVLSGESAQQWFTFHASHVAGMYQQVFNVTPGQHYRFSIWAQVWSSIEDNAYESVLPANPHLQIGIDPTGNWNAGAPTVVWSGEAPMSGVIDQWGLMSIEAAAQNDVITVFMRTSPDFANKHNDMYWDNAALEAVQPPLPTAVPSPTSGPATNTPQATATTASTNTPTPSPTATPTATPTLPPTATPEPTNTATPTATNTPEPTATPTATETAPAAQAVADSSADSDLVAGDSTPEGALAETDRQNVAEADRLGIAALLAIGLAIALLVLLIAVLLRSVRAR